MIFGIKWLLLQIYRVTYDWFYGQASQMSYTDNKMHA